MMGVIVAYATIVIFDFLETIKWHNKRLAKAITKQLRLFMHKIVIYVITVRRSSHIGWKLLDVLRFRWLVCIHLVAMRAVCECPCAHVSGGEIPRLIYSILHLVRDEYFCIHINQYPLLLIRINLNPSMYPYLHSLSSVGWNYLSIPKIQRFHTLLGM